MPTHIYTRLGDWDGVIRGNLRAAEAALEYPAGEHGEFVWDEFRHAIEYLVYAYLQKGDDAAAAQIEAAAHDGATRTHLQDGVSPGVDASRYALERRAWRQAAQIVPRQPATLDGTVSRGRRPSHVSPADWAWPTNARSMKPKPKANGSINLRP